MARTRNPANGRLEEALTTLLQNQAELVQNQTAFVAQMRERDREMIEMQRRFARIDDRFAQVEPAPRQHRGRSPGAQPNFGTPPRRGPG